MLVPTMCMFLIYVFFYWGNFDKLGYCLHNEFKWGYWFTFSLFLMNLLHFSISTVVKIFLFKEQKKELYVLAFMLTTIMPIILLKDWDEKHNDTFLINWFSLRLVAMYFPFLYVGIGKQAL